MKIGRKHTTHIEVKFSEVLPDDPDEDPNEDGADGLWLVQIDSVVMGLVRAWHSDHDGALAKLLRENAEDAAMCLCSEAAHVFGTPTIEEIEEFYEDEDAAESGGTPTSYSSSSSP